MSHYEITGEAGSRAITIPLLDYFLYPPKVPMHHLTAEERVQVIEIMVKVCVEVFADLDTRPLKSLEGGWVWRRIRHDPNIVSGNTEMLFLQEEHGPRKAMPYTGITKDGKMHRIVLYRDGATVSWTILDRDRMLQLCEKAPEGTSWSAVVVRQLREAVQNATQRRRNALLELKRAIQPISNIAARMYL